MPADSPSDGVAVCYSVAPIVRRRHSFVEPRASTFSSRRLRCLQMSSRHFVESELRSNASRSHYVPRTTVFLETGTTRLNASQPCLSPVVSHNFSLFLTTIECLSIGLRHTPSLRRSVPRPSSSSHRNLNVRQCRRELQEHLLGGAAPLLYVHRCHHVTAFTLLLTC